MPARGLLVIAFGCSLALAAPVPKSLKKPADKFTTARFNVNYDRVAFYTVLRNFADETGLEWVGHRPHMGTVTLKSLPGKMDTGAEFIDLLNERLELEKLILIRHGHTFYLHAAGQPIDVEKVDTIPAEDLLPLPTPAKAVGGKWEFGQWVPNGPVEKPPPPPKRGKTELATAVIELPPGVKDKDVRPQLVKALTKYGRLEEADGSGTTRVTDRVDNLRFYNRVVNERPTACYLR